MPRQARIQSESNYYHIMMRGNNRENIFNWDGQKLFFIELLEIQKADGLLDIVAYCLMDNHVHIIVNAELKNIATTLKVTNIKYAMKFNRELGRVGHVFQDRYKSEGIDDERYLLQVIRYVHNNPVKAKMVSQPADYKWSSFNEYINSTKIISHQQKELD